MKPPSRPPQLDLVKSTRSKSSRPKHVPLSNLPKSNLPEKQSQPLYQPVKEVKEESRFKVRKVN
jgi:hypothetical protein